MDNVKTGNAPNTAGAKQENGSPLTETLKAHTTRGSRVLVVDDNAILLRTVKEMIGDRYHVSIAASGSQAFASIAKNLPDLILLDYEMPYTNGVEVLQRLRADASTRNIPVIFFTSTAEREMVAKLVESHPDGYLLKPPNKEKMIALIDKTLKAKRESD